MHFNNYYCYDRFRGQTSGSRHKIKMDRRLLPAALVVAVTVACAAATTESPSSTEWCAHQATAFVGLDAEGSLVLCPPKDSGTVHVGGTLHNPALSEALRMLRAENDQLLELLNKTQTRLALLEQRIGYATCAERYRFGGTAFTGEGVYELRTMAGVRFYAYCNANGWTLIRNQADPGRYFTYTSASHALQSRTDPGIQSHLDHIISSATMMRYTDINETIMLEATFDGALYWKTVSGSTCGLVPVRYTSGLLAGVDRFIDVASNSYWGHRHNSGPPCGGGAGDDVRDVVSSGNAHVCLDVWLRNRPFAGTDGCCFPSFCPGYEPAYVFPANAGAIDGGFLYQQWVF